MSFIKPGTPPTREQCLILRDYLYAQSVDLELLRRYLRDLDYAHYLGLFRELQLIINSLNKIVSRISKHYASYSHYHHTTAELLNHIADVIEDFKSSNIPGVPGTHPPTDDYPRD